MFDFGFGELLLIGVVALVVLGPERLPKAARMAGNLVGRMQRMVSSVKQELNAQMELDELRKAKQEIESAAEGLRSEIGSMADGTQSSLNEIADGLKPWERVPEMRTPADFGLDENGRPLENSAAETETEPVSEQEKAWQAYLMPSEQPAPPEVHYRDYGHDYGGARSGFQTASLRKQALRRKRDMRPRHRPKPQLRVRKK